LNNFYNTPPGQKYDKIATVTQSTGCECPKPVAHILIIFDKNLPMRLRRQLTMLARVRRHVGPQSAVLKLNLDKCTKIFELLSTSLVQISEGIKANSLHDNGSA
jgi:hypothetical protein